MRCFEPLTLRRKNAEGFSVIETVPCGKCIACINRRRSDWAFRLEVEADNSLLSRFITLTYSDENLPITDCGYPTVNKRDVQLFIKRFRKSVSPVKIRYFCVSEYGDKFSRPHYHCLMFFSGIIGDIQLALSQSWSLGHVRVDSITPARIMYCTKYMLKSDFEEDSDATPPFSLMSTKPAIGHSYLESAQELYHLDGHRNYITRRGGFKAPLPRYYKDKIFVKGTYFPTPAQDELSIGKKADVVRSFKRRAHFNKFKRS